MRRLVIKTALAAAALVLAGTAAAQDIKERTLKLGLQNPKGHPVVMGAEKFAELGFRDLTNGRRPIHKVEDIAGLKLRVIPSPINIDRVKALDANPTPLAFPELYAALEQKAVEGQENPVSVILANKFAEVQKYLTQTHHQYNPQSVIISKKAWDTMSAAERQILQDATAEASRYERQVSRDQADSTIAQQKKAGMQVTELPAAEQAKMREKMKPVIDKHAATVGDATVRELIAELARLRK